MTDARAWLISGAVAIAAALALMFLGWTVAAGAYGARIDAVKAQAGEQVETMRAEQAAELAKLGNEYRERERGWANDLQKVAEDGQAEIDQARGDAAAAVRVSVGLRERARILAARCSPAAPGAAPTASGPATEGPGLVLADVFGRADDTAGELAAAYDAARAAGRACERAYDAVRGEQ